MQSSRFCLFLVLAFILAACSRPPDWHGTDVSGMLPDLEFALLDSRGQPVTAESFRGKVTLLFFGFTNCPGPCPTTLAQLGVVLKDMRELSREVKVLLVTVDPRRDSPEALERYTASFGPWLHGLTGSEVQLEAVKLAYKVYAQRQLADADGNYDVSHNAAVFVFDGQGRARLLYSDVTDTAAVVADLAYLVTEAY